MKIEVLAPDAVSFTIPYPGKPRGNGKSLWLRNYSLNSIYAGVHWTKRQKHTEEFHWLVKAALMESNIPLRKFEHPVMITFRWNDGLDIDNHAYMGKLIVDTLKGDLLYDDDKRYYVRCVHEFHGGEGIRVIIEEV